MGRGVTTEGQHEEATGEPRQRLSVDILIVVITRLWVAVNFHELAHQKTYTVKKFKFLIF